MPSAAQLRACPLGDDGPAPQHGPLPCRRFGITQINLFVLDVEGAELEVLRTLDWGRVRCVAGRGAAGSRRQVIRAAAAAAEARPAELPHLSLLLPRRSA